MDSPAYQVLVADDDPTVGLLMRAALNGVGIGVTVVEDGRAALDAFAQDHFDLLLLDVEMPEVDGLTVCSIVRQSPRGDTPIVLVTGHGDQAFFEKAAALNAGYLAKPVDWSLLGARILDIMRFNRSPRPD